MLNQFFSGAIFMAYVVITMLMLRFWQRTHDRLFLFFGATFTILCIERIILFALASHTEFTPYVYLVRLLAFVVIIVGIVDKNRT